MSNQFKVNDKLLATFIGYRCAYVLNHPKSRHVIVEVSENFVIAKKIVCENPENPIFEAVPKNYIISIKAFECFQGDREDLEGLMKKIFGKNYE